MSENKTGKSIALILAILFLMFFIFISNSSTDSLAMKMTGVAIMMAVLWVSEAIPLGATSLLPIVLFPLLGISEAGSVASEYFNNTIFLFVGGFLIAIAMESWNLHRRIALLIIMFLGSGSSGIVLGFLIASAFLSMFISNTATALMMLPIGLSVVTKMNQLHAGKDADKFAVSIMLSIAYGASLGGIATLVGTPPNLAFVRIFQISFPDAPQISFGMWTLLVLPITVIMLLVAWVLMTKILYRVKNNAVISKSMVKDEFLTLGKTSYEEWVVLVVFVLTALLWIFRTDLNFGFATLSGWSSILGNNKFVDDSTVAIFMSLILFVIPSKNFNSKRLLNLDAFGKLPWEIILLFGGGFALASGFQSSGLSQMICNQLETIKGLPPLLMIMIISITMAVLTEFTSNTAITQTMLPILAALSLAMKLNPMLLMIPATLSASLAFMLPVSTPPNAIVFSSGKVTIRQMFKTGLLLDIIGVILVSVLFYYLGDFMLGINPNQFPLWAVPK
jgi:sodium-dependent dicarboxylate transporter 2/3/5